MQANFYNTKNTITHSSRTNGFTLLELLVVVVIVAILFTYTTLAIRSDSPEDIIKKEAQRMERLIQLALEESILRGEEYGLEVALDGYRFLRFTRNQWQPLTGDKILRARELPLDMELEMRLEETEIVIDMAAGSGLGKKFDIGGNLSSNSSDNQNNKEEEKKKAIKPQIYLLSSGEITPEFDVRFYILGIETSYFVKGAFDGSLKTEISDL
ncbi:hypothetical protein MNBD_GAMMA06-665 [hydrothermal vent metagenome]|uniref:Type II secretion system protein H n=1 Tax=hydrothermal vent metagenome TaxID=652676 RepID=A0A3B0W685_9ZZZZ